MTAQLACPELQQVSLPVGISERGGPASELVPLNLFESRKLPANVGCVAHVGGPVVALDWNPSASGVIAVGALPADTPALRVTQSYAGEGHIQLWKCAAGGFNARCVGLVDHEGFAALDLKWAPNAHPDTLSLLAAALADGSVLVYDLKDALSHNRESDMLNNDPSPTQLSPPVVVARKSGAMYSVRRQSVPVVARTIAWRADGRAFAVGSTDGSVAVYTLHVQGYHIASLSSGIEDAFCKRGVPRIYESWSVTLHPGGAVLAMDWLSPYTLATSGTDGVIRVGDVRDPAITTESIVDRNVWTTSIRGIPTSEDCLAVTNDQGYVRFLKLRGSSHLRPRLYPLETSFCNLLLDNSTLRCVEIIPVVSPSRSKVLPDSGAQSASAHGAVEPNAQDGSLGSTEKTFTDDDVTRSHQRLLVYAGCSSGVVHEINIATPPWDAMGSKLDPDVSQFFEVMIWRPVSADDSTMDTGDSENPLADQMRKSAPFGGEICLEGLILDWGSRHNSRRQRATSGREGEKKDSTHRHGDHRIGGDEVATQTGSEARKPGDVDEEMRVDGRNESGVEIGDDPGRRSEGGTRTVQESFSTFGPRYVHEVVTSRLSADCHYGILAVGTLGGFVSFIHIKNATSRKTDDAQDHEDLEERLSPVTAETPCVQSIVKRSMTKAVAGEKRQVRMTPKLEALYARRRVRRIERERQRTKSAEERSKKLAEAERKRKAELAEKERLERLRADGLRSVEERLEQRRLKAMELRKQLQEAADRGRRG